MAAAHGLLVLDSLGPRLPFCIPVAPPTPQPLKLLGLILLCYSANHCPTTPVNLQAPWKGYNPAPGLVGSTQGQSLHNLNWEVDVPRAWWAAPAIVPFSAAWSHPPMDPWAPKPCGIFSIHSPLPTKPTLLSKDSMATTGPSQRSTGAEERLSPS